IFIASFNKIDEGWGIDVIQGNWRTNVKRLRGTYECILRREGVLFMWTDLKGVRSKTENIPKNIIDGESTNHCSECCFFFCFRRSIISHTNKPTSMTTENSEVMILGRCVNKIRNMFRIAAGTIIQKYTRTILFLKLSSNPSFSSVIDHTSFVSDAFSRKPCSVKMI